MKYKLKAYSIWEFGKRKDAEGNPHQEDSLYPAFGKESDADRLFILCDGMGGHDAGEVASATVCEAMSRSVLNDGHDDGRFSDSDLDAAISAAFEALDRKDNGAEKKMGTTMTFLKLHDEGATIAHMGDSRVYHIRPGKTGEDTEILFQTEDHSLVNDLIKIGELTREEARHSKQKNIITRAMQPNMDRKPRADVYHTVDIKPGDYFYMCSDGMLEQPEMESGESLRNIFSEMGGDDKRKVEILTGATDENRDNHTAFIIHILDVIDPVKPESAPLAMPTKHVAVIDESDDDSVVPEPHEDKTVRSIANHRQTKKSDARTRSLIIGLLAVAIVVALCFVGGIKSCSDNVKGENKEKVEDPKKNGNNGSKPSQPSNPEAPAASPAPPARHASPAAAPATPTHHEPATPDEESGSHPAIGIPSFSRSDGDVVNSNEQVVIDNANGRNRK